jgi:pilus assembly protein CpaE
MGGLRADGQNIGLAQDQGLLVGQIRSKSPYAADVAKLAETLGQRLERGAGL